MNLSAHPAPTTFETGNGFAASKISPPISSCLIPRPSGQIPSFDRAFFPQIIDVDEQEKLRLPYHWLDLASMYWATSPNPSRTGISKDAIASAHKLPPEAKPHRAMNGTRHLIACYWAVMNSKC